jgi:cytochrome c553/mono/diheme cytochrome c family protein
MVAWADDGQRTEAIVQQAEVTAATFEQMIAPIFTRHCVACHGSETQEGSLRLDSRAGLVAGGGTGAVIVPGAAAESLLVQAIRRVDESLSMPPEGPLAAEDVAAIAAWVDAGAPHPDGPIVPASPKVTLAGGRDHWSLQPIERPAVPGGHATHPIDAFLEAALAESGLLPTPRADGFTLARRLAFDLTGLPPDADRSDRFAADPSPEALADFIDDLLASPHYGEHWGRHWLDVVRYADSNGLDENVAHGNAWRYRDYVIAAFNTDKPFDAFVREQIAGDLMVRPDDPPARRAELLTATGFLVLGPKVLAEGDETKLLMDIIDEQIDTAGKAFLGLALGCARCHDHKFDPVSHADYYALAGIFQSTRTMESLARIAKWHENIIATPAEQEAHARATREIEAAKQAVDAFLSQTRASLASAGGGPAAAEIPEDTFPDDAKARLAELRAIQKQREESRAELPSAMGVTEGEPTATAIHLRGSHLTLGRTVPRGIPAVLQFDGPLAIPDDASGRLQLAEWLTDPRHPLTARVIVNRVWRWHFGRGLVASTDNFGTTGDRPVHGPLLDWLAAELIDSGWSLKHLHRLILTSSSWQRSSDPARSPTAAAAATIDPDNLLWWRADVRRLEAESIRDAMLAVSGRLDTTMGGSLLHVDNRAFLFDHTSKDETDYDVPRRSVYLPVIRNHIQDALWLFDCTDGAVPDGDRATSTVASQALWLLNADLPMQAAGSLAADAIAMAPDEAARQVEFVFRRVLGRPPTTAETGWFLEQVALLRPLVASWEREALAGEGEASQQPSPEERAWAAAIQALLVSDQFLVVR